MASARVNKLKKRLETVQDERKQLARDHEGCAKREAELSRSLAGLSASREEAHQQGEATKAEYAKSLAAARAAAEQLTSDIAAKDKEIAALTREVEDHRQRARLQMQQQHIVLAAGGNVAPPPPMLGYPGPSQPFQSPPHYY